MAVKHLIYSATHTLCCRNSCGEIKLFCEYSFYMCGILYLARRHLSILYMLSACELFRLFLCVSVVLSCLCFAIMCICVSDGLSNNIWNVLVRASGSGGPPNVPDWKLFSLLSFEGGGEQKSFFDQVLNLPLLIRFRVLSNLDPPPVYVYLYHFHQRCLSA